MMDRERAGHIYLTMVRIRAFESKALKLFEENKLRGSVHLYMKRPWPQRSARG